MSLLGRCLLIVVVLGTVGCAKKAPHDPFTDPPDEIEYDPAPAEVPLAVDFEKAARRRVKAQNYREELRRIERELALAARLR